MSQWERAIGPSVCGRCSKHIRRGDPILVFAFPGLKAGRQIRIRKLRCGDCAGGAPPDLPGLAVPKTFEPMPLAKFSPAMLPLDWKARSAGAREPGEEG